jgi:hypothetical protein
MILVRYRAGSHLWLLMGAFAFSGFLGWWARPTSASLITSSPRSVSIDSISGLRYFGFYGVSDASVMSHHGNLIFTESARDIRNAGTFHIKAFEHVGASLTSADEIHWAAALAQWNLRADSIRPYASDIAAFYLYGEPYGQLGYLGRSVAYQRLRRAAKAVKETFPGIPVAIAEAADNLTTHYSGQEYSVPPEIDWVGFDCYDGTFTNCGASHKSIPEFLALLKAAIDPTRQRIFLIPPSFYSMPSTGPEIDILSAIRHGGPCTATPNCKTQDSLAAISGRYFLLAKSDRTIVAIMAFTGGLYEESHNLFLGALDMPRVRAAYDQIFGSIPGNDAIANAPYPSGTQLVPVDGVTKIRTHFPQDTVWPAVQVLDAQSRFQRGVNVECTPSQDSRVLWRTRPTGTNDPTNAFFGWILGSLPDHTYALHCQSPATGDLSVIFSATTSKLTRIRN